MAKLVNQLKKLIEIQVIKRHSKTFSHRYNKTKILALLLMLVLHRKIKTLLPIKLIIQILIH